MSRRGSSKSQLFLMEFICVVMFFSLCSALCISAFVKADQISKEGLELNEALLLAQSTAETIKAMDNVKTDEIGSAVEKINQVNGKKYMVKVKDTVENNMLLADIFVYEKEHKQKEICNISIKKYLPEGVDYGK